jgi:tetratricopeptide (TPR) repeat protein
MVNFLDALKAETLLFKAAEALQRKKLDETKVLLDKGLCHAPAHGGLLLTMAYVQLSQGDFPGCQETLAKATSAMGESPIIPLYEGILSLSMGDAVQASTFFKKSLERSPRNQLCQNYLSLCGIMTGAVRDGLSEIKRTGIYSNARLSGFLSIAIEKLLMKSEKSEKKESEVSKTEEGIVTEQPTETGEHAGESSKTSERDHDQAGEPDVQHEREVKDLPPSAIRENDSPALLPEKKNTLPGRKKIADYILNPPLGLFYWFLGQHYLNRGNFERASHVLERVLDLAPETQRIHFHLGEAFFYQNRLSPAFEHFNESLTRDGENGEVLYYLGKCRQEKELFDEAEKDLEKSFALFPKSPETLYSLGQISMRKGDERRAQQYFEETAEYDFAILGERIKELEKRQEQGAEP